MKQWSQNPKVRECTGTLAFTDSHNIACSIRLESVYLFYYAPFQRFRLIHQRSVRKGLKISLRAIRSRVSGCVGWVEDLTPTSPFIPL